ncbi:MAG: DUF1501 domain-containing protein [Pirellulales bacterium]|nr:DUF1501 domain-containing protein [Pirellulales bacterium]
MSPTRREFLKTSVGTAALASLATCPSSLTAAVGARRDSGDKVLVIVELAGGNDGLNSIIPFEDDIYGRSRTTLRLTRKEVLKINDQLGFHPALKGFRRIFDEGHLSVLQGVGYPKPNGGHDGAVMDWHSAQPHQTNRQTGWVGRVIDSREQLDSDFAPAVVVGQINRPFCLNAERTIVPSINSSRDFVLRSAGNTESLSDHHRRLVESAEPPRTESDNPLLDIVRKNQLSAYSTSRRIDEVIQKIPAMEGHYPQSLLAGKLHTISQLIRAETGIKVFFTGFGGGGIGGFDNHANQRDNHAALLRQLSESVAAFVDDLKRQKLLDRVVLMTFSEFGRTLKENGRKGTGHGSAAPMFLAGGKLKGGLVGEHPSLTELENGGPKHHTDFRRVYATVLDNWLGFDSRPVLGDGFAPLDVFET